MPEQERTGLKNQPRQILHIRARRIVASGACFIFPLKPVQPDRCWVKWHPAERQNCQESKRVLLLRPTLWEGEDTT